MLEELKEEVDKLEARNKEIKAKGLLVAKKAANILQANGYNKVELSNIWPVIISRENNRKYNEDDWILRIKSRSGTLLLSARIYKCPMRIVVEPNYSCELQEFHDGPWVKSLEEDPKLIAERERLRYKINHLVEEYDGHFQPLEDQNEVPMRNTTDTLSD